MKKVPAVLLAVTGVAFLFGYFARGHGMGMGGGGMMGGGMMHSSSNDKTPSVAANPRAANALLAYIHDNKLSCTQCHAVSAGGVGPSFVSLSASYAKRADAVTVLEDHIEHGFRAMPGGMANRAQAANLAKLILDLTSPQAK